MESGLIMYKYKKIPLAIQSSCKFILLHLPRYDILSAVDTN